VGSVTSAADALALVQKNLVIYCDFGYTAFFMLFFIIYKVRTTMAIRRLSKEIASPADFAIKVDGIPQDYPKVEKIKHFMEDLYGPVVECKFARIFGGVLTGYQKQDALNKKMRIQEIPCKVQAEEEGSDVAEVMANSSALQKLRV